MGQDQLNEKEQEIDDLKLKVGDLIQKNTDYISKFEKEQENIEMIEEFYQNKVEEMDFEFRDQIKKLEESLKKKTNKLGKMKNGINET